MDEVSCAANSLDAKLGIFPKQTSKSQEGLDENMADSSGTLNPQLDSSMPEPHLEELQVSDKDGKYKMVEESGVTLTNSFTAENTLEPLNVLPCE